MSRALWTSSEAAIATGGKVGADWSAVGVSIDTRTIDLGDLFVALVGDNSDGHAHVKDALAKGAAAAMVAQPCADVSAEGLLIVEDTLAGLQALGRAARARTDAKIVAVTGSVGKTSTKDALRAILEAQGRTHGSVASYNNHWGVPLTLARMPADTEWGVFEIGMNHAGEITPLSQMVQPDAAIITTVEPVHLANFKNVEGIADAKAEIFDGLKPGGTAILNADNPHFDRLRSRAQAAGAGEIISFGTSDKADARLEKVALHPTCSCISASICGHAITYKLGVPGEHHVMNSLAILAAVHALGADMALAGMTLATLNAPKGRGVRHVVRSEAGQFVVVDESYNANPASMRAAIGTLGAAEIKGSGRRIAVLGDMLELGEDEASMHRGLAGPLGEAGIDQVFACGPLMKNLYEELPASSQAGYAASSDALLEQVTSQLGDGDVVMVKGSLGSRMGLIVDALVALHSEDNTPVGAGD